MPLPGTSASRLSSTCSQHCRPCRSTTLGVPIGPDGRAQHLRWCGLSRGLCVALAILAIALAVGLAAGLAIGLSRQSEPSPGGPPQQDDASTMPARPFLPPPPAPGLAINATCGGDTECASDLCLSSRCAQAGTVPDKGTCNRSKQCESGVCDGAFNSCKLDRGSICAYLVDNFCASSNCAKNGTCL